ncbi:hypothetical protein KKF34_03455 [Myxococcota bacterium]|nr:hypothetical protein [Myxococcota bacterium]MBU1382152.1 hypothetical protein [Myxococcota bacterium]MBU1495913.1 hypothetical protein [Myxococcota bacterium]
MVKYFVFSFFILTFMISCASRLQKGDDYRRQKSYGSAISMYSQAVVARDISVNKYKLRMDLVKKEYGHSPFCHAVDVLRKAFALKAASYASQGNLRESDRNLRIAKTLILMYRYHNCRSLKRL